MTWLTRFRVWHPQLDNDRPNKDTILIDETFDRRPFRIQIPAFGTQDYGEPLFASLKILTGTLLGTVDHVLFTGLIDDRETKRIVRIHLTGMQAALSSGSTYTFPLWHTWGETVRDARLEFFTSGDLS